MDNLALIFIVFGYHFVKPLPLENFPFTMHQTNLTAEMAASGYTDEDFRFLSPAEIEHTRMIYNSLGELSGTYRERLKLDSNHCVTERIHLSATGGIAARGIYSYENGRLKSYEDSQSGVLRTTTTYGFAGDTLKSERSLYHHDGKADTTDIAYTYADGLPVKVLATSRDHVTETILSYPKPDSATLIVRDDGTVIHTGSYALKNGRIMRIHGPGFVFEFTYGKTDVGIANRYGKTRQGLPVDQVDALGRIPFGNSITDPGGPRKLFR